MDLDLAHWERFVPNLGNNRKAAAGEQLALEIATGLTKMDLEAFQRFASHLGAPVEIDQAEAARVAGERKEVLEDVKARMYIAARAKKLAEQMKPFVRWVGGNHTINKQPVTGLEDYFRALLVQVGFYNWTELTHEVFRLNSFDGGIALFYEPPAGGSTSTPPSQDQKGSVEDQSGGR